MASEGEEADQDESVDEERSTFASNGRHTKESAGEEEASEEEEEDEDEEPRLKYASLTKHLKPVYRNGDATSAILVAGDKMVSQASLLEDLGGTDSVPDSWNPQWEYCKPRLVPMGMISLICE